MMVSKLRDRQLGNSTLKDRNMNILEAEKQRKKEYMEYRKQQEEYKRQDSERALLLSEYKSFEDAALSYDKEREDYINELEEDDLSGVNPLEVEEYNQAADKLAKISFSLGNKLKNDEIIKISEELESEKASLYGEKIKVESFNNVYSDYISKETKGKDFSEQLEEFGSFVNANAELISNNSRNYKLYESLKSKRISSEEYLNQYKNDPNYTVIDISPTEQVIKAKEIEFVERKWGGDNKKDKQDKSKYTPHEIFLKEGKIDKEVFRGITPTTRNKSYSSYDYRYESFITKELDYDNNFLKNKTEFESYVKTQKSGNNGKDRKIYDIFQKSEKEYMDNFLKGGWTAKKPQKRVYDITPVQYKLKYLVTPLNEKKPNKQKYQDVYADAFNKSKNLFKYSNDVLGSISKKDKNAPIRLYWSREKYKPRY